MEKGQLLFSLLFFVSAFIYTAFAIYIVKNNIKPSLNRIFTTICICLSIWAFSFGMANLTENMDKALLWHRISAFGWVPLYTLIVHFMLILTGRKKIVKKRLYKVFLYIPSLMLLYPFAFSKKLSYENYEMIQTIYGWNNKLNHTGWDVLFYVVYSSCLLISVILLFTWKTEKNKYEKNQLILISTSMIITIFVGTFVDIIFTGINKTLFSQIGPILCLIPIFAIYYSVRYYSMMNLGQLESEKILDKKTEKNIYTYTYLLFFICSAISFILSFIDNFIEVELEKKLTLYSGFVFLTYGILIWKCKFIKNEIIGNIVKNLLLNSSLLVISLLFIDYAAVAIWAFPFILIILSLVYNSRNELIMLSCNAIITQFILWIYADVKIVEIRFSDFIIRIIIFLLFLFIGLVVNNVYIKRLKKNNEQMEFQKILSETYYEFIDVNEDSFEGKLQNLLRKLNTFIKSDLTSLLLMDSKNNTLITVAVEISKNFEEYIVEQRRKVVGNETFTWLELVLKNDGIMIIDNIEDLPEVANEGKEYLRNKGISSMVLIPLVSLNKIEGVLCIAYKGVKARIDSEKIMQLKIPASVLVDVLSKIESKKMIEYRGHYDHLTGLLNRKSFNDKLETKINERLSENIEYKKKNNEIAIMFLDLDGFKEINDSFGHKYGDLLIKSVAERIKRVVEKNYEATVARFGGDEFLIMVENVSNEEIHRVSRKIMKVLKKSFYILGQEVIITGSIGISIFPRDGKNIEDILKNADSAMYKAKELGKNRYVICTKEMREDWEREMIISKDMHNAFLNSKMELYYQPQVDVKSNEIKGVEALLRWNHPKLGILSPDVFIPIAEKNGEINRIGEWVLETAIKQNKEWQDKGYKKITVAVNFSVAQFRNINLAKMTKNILEKSGMESKYLELEITESVASDDSEYIVKTLNSFKKMGILLAIDDFGMEYSSLNRLKMTPVSSLKIDKEFVQAAEKSDKDKSIIEIILGLARNLKIDVVAEGVETEEQKKFLEVSGCKYIQGYYYYKPMSKKDMETLLRKISD